MPFLTLTIMFAALQFAESIQNQKYFLLLKFTVYLTIYCFSLELYELSPSSFFRSSGVICQKDEVILILHLIQHSVIFEVWGFFPPKFLQDGVLKSIPMSCVSLHPQIIFSHKQMENIVSQLDDICR